MAYNFQSPFAQALIAEGRARGVSPFAIASSLGNAAQENGLNTNGRPGDNGTAFGAFQWRNERKAALDALASKMGRSWDDPGVQAKHWWDEQAGSESRWGLTKAGDLQSAVKAGISSLRPAGWTAGNPMGGHGFDNRLAASQAALSYLQGDQAPTAGDTAPVAGSEDSETLIGGSGSDTLQAPPKEGWEAFLSGGPGALFGKPQEGWSLTDALGGISVAMMARDNPAGAAAVSQWLNGSRKADKDKFDMKYDPRSGKLIKIDRHGNVSTQQINQPQRNLDVKFTPDGQKVVTNMDDGSTVSKEQVFNAPEKPIPASAVNLFQENRSKADINLRAMEKNQQFVSMIQNGDVDLDAFSKMGNSFSQFMGASDQKVRNAAMLTAHIEEMRNARLLEAKGVQTEGDAVRALDALLPGNSKFDKKSVAQLLNGLSDDFENSAKRYTTQYGNLAKSYKNYDPENLYAQEYEPKFKSYGERKAAIQGRMPAFLAETDAPKQGTVTGANPVHSGGGNPAPTQTQGSFKDFYNRNRRQ